MITQDSTDARSFKIQDLLATRDGNAWISNDGQPGARYLTYLPLYFNDGKPIEVEKLEAIIHQVVAFCGGATVSLERVGAWFDTDAGLLCWETVVVIDALVIHPDAEKFFGDLKTEAEALLEQYEVFIVCQSVAKIEAPSVLQLPVNGSDLVQVTQLVE